MKSAANLYHVTILSNFARGFDKYSRSYSKAHIPESTFPDQFFLLFREELEIGVRKASHLLEKLPLVGDRLIVLETEIDPSELHENLANGRGHFINSNQIVLANIYEIETSVAEIELRPINVEMAMAASLRVINRHLIPFADIRPRAVSFLPVALACQAKCPFCFSKASASAYQAVAKPNWEQVSSWLDRAKAAGAERAVITGGGEPTLLPPAQLERLIRACSSRFDKVVLITNGHILSKAGESELSASIGVLSDAGLRVLAISRHHFDDGHNEELMHLRTPVEALVRTWKEHEDRWSALRMRFICVLQKGGVCNEDTVAGYLSWAAELGVQEVCFKELYVSTSDESIYHDHSANEWSRRHQVSLSLVTAFVERHGFLVESSLPWGAPVYRGVWKRKVLRIAAYTEPSLLWERTNGIARSWNVMADGRCLVSLEDRASEIR